MSFVASALNIQITGTGSLRFIRTVLAIWLSFAVFACQTEKSEKQPAPVVKSTETPRQDKLQQTVAALDLAYKQENPDRSKVLPLLEQMLSLLREMGEIKRALFYAKRIYAIRLSDANTVPLDAARATYDLAELFRRLSAPELAIDAYRRTVDIYKRLPDQERQILIVELRLGFFLHDQGRFDAAEGLLRGLLARLGRPELQEIFKSQQVDSRKIIDRLVTVRRARGDLVGVAALLSLAQHGGQVTKSEVATLAQRVAMLDAETGNYRLARANLTRILRRQQMQKIPDPKLQADLLDAIAKTHIDDAQYDAAANLIERVQSLRQQSAPGSVSDQISALLHAAARSRQIKRVDNAKLFVSRAARSLPQMPQDQIHLRRSVNLSRIENYLAAGFPENARGQALRFDRNLIAKAGRRSILRIPGLRQAARAARMRNQLRRADDLVFLACEIARENLGPWDPLTISLYAELGRIRLVRELLQERLIAVNAASHGHRISFRNAMLSAFPDRLTNLRQSRKVFLGHVDAVANILTQKNPPGGAIRRQLLSQAFEAMQLARAAGMAQRQKSITAIFETAGAAGRSSLVAILKQRQDLAHRIKVARKHLRNKRELGQDADIDLALVSVRKLWQEQLDLDAKLTLDHPAFVKLSGFAPVNLPTVQASLNQAETLLVFLTGRNKSFVFVLRHDKAMLLPIRAAGPQLARRVKRLRRRLDPTREANRRRDFRYDVTGAFALYRLLLAPVKNRGGLKGRLLIVPDGALASLPFAALVSKLPSAQEKINANYYLAAPWLVRDHPIMMLPSVRVLHGRPTGPKTARRPGKFKVIKKPSSPKDAAFQPTPAAGSMPFLAFADPMFNGEDRGLRGINTGKLFARASVATAGVIGRRGLLQLPNLQETGGEMYNLAKRLGAPRSNVILQENANEAAIKSLHKKPITILSLATHGLITGNFYSFGEPGLAFAPPKDPFGGAPRIQANDGVLRLSEIIGLQLNAKWLVLSALNTVDAEGRANATGLSSLLLALQHAGVDNILAAHWSVAPNPMAELMAKTIENSSPTQSADRMLRENMLKMILDVNSPELRHPMMWAPVFAVMAAGKF